MKKLILLLLLFLSTFIGAQNFEKDWQKVYEFELNGKNKSAQEIVAKIQKKASRKKDEKEVIKCFLYSSKFELLTNEEGQTEILKNLDAEIKRSSPIAKSFFYYIKATILLDYKEKNSNKIARRSKIATKQNSNFLTWNLDDFDAEIDKDFENIFIYTEALVKQNILDWKNTIEIPFIIDGKNYSLYDFFYLKYHNYLTSKVYLRHYQPKEYFTNFIDLFSKPSKEFSAAKINFIENNNLQKLTKIIQNYESYYQSENNDKTDQSYYDRLKYIAQFNNNLDIKKIISVIEKITTNEALKQQIKLDNANELNKLAFQNKDVFYHKQALQLIDSILERRINPKVLIEAEQLKFNILNRQLHIEMLPELYPHQNNRAFVRYKNVDSLKISYYKFPLNLSDEINNYRNSYLKDSLVLNFIQKNKAVKSCTKTLPNADDYFEHTTEILLEKLAIGNYLIFFETKNNSTSKTNAFSYSQVSVTNFYVVEEHAKNNDNLYILNRKNGQPIQNIKIISNEEIVKTNSIGKTSFQKQEREENKKYNNKLLLVKESDSIHYNYKREFIYSDERYDSFEAKAQIFTDRAIYRPGQKMYYKSILVQKIDTQKNIVPFVTVKLIIEDSKGNKIKAEEIQTNEFGSFSGEFEIPKSVITGKFSIYVDEPDNYENDKKYYNTEEDEHSFWDNVDFDNWQGRVDFFVEEYKRPTFEVTFYKTKENYTIGDTLKITGNAKSLAGNNLTDAKVTYTISRSTSVKEKFIPYEENFVVSETKTDKNGNFTIFIPATHNEVLNDSINYFHFTINADVTDTNGETRNASKQVFVEQKMLKLNIFTEYTYYKEKENKVTIRATTLNDYPIATNATVEIYQINQKQFRKQRLFQVPENSTISKEDFEQLFPEEPYDYNDSEPWETLIKTQKINTAETSVLDLSFLKNYENGTYKIVVNAKDKKGNNITDKRIFFLDSKVKPDLKNNIFGYKNITKSESDYIEIELYSEVSNLWITTRYIEINSKNFNTQINQLENGKKVLKFRKSENAISFQFSTIWENIPYAQELVIFKPVEETNLLIEIESFRNKIEPGSNENWSFKIANSKLESEILASMYDSSLDFFTTTNWQRNLFNNHAFSGLNFPHFYSYQKRENIWFNNLKIFEKKYNQNYNTPFEINWFGFNFNNFKYISEQYLKKVKTWSKIPKGAKMISGIVSDELGPVVGGNVVIKGTTTGTTTDFDGNYLIPAKEGDVLEISFVGMITEEVTIGTANQYNVTLKEGVLLDDLVITALGIKRKPDLSTSNYELIVGEDLADSSNLSQALVGRVSGLNIQTTSVGLNNNRITLNGNRSITGNNEALIIIDGVIATAAEFNNLKTENVHEIQIIKGAQGAALYGSDGVNGVIIVTTKSALKQLVQVKTRTNFNETAFFYPQLRTDNNGKILFNFTTPESLTKWKLRLFAHNNNFETGYLESSIISQKELMVHTNMPRFFRENDSITLSAKVANMTTETKSGMAMLMLFNAENNQPIDSISLNTNNHKNFTCKPKESVTLNWTITIPKNISGLQYKIVAKSSTFADGEENIIPVLSNKIVLTESRNIWLKGNTKKEIVFENLLNTNSTSLENQKLTLEYTSSPIWIVLQSLPYLLEYEHDCAEQTFARYYANFIASKIINSNDKIKNALENWKNNNVKSKFTLNEELKSIVLNETPWLLDAESDEEKNSRLALLLDLSSLKDSQENTFKKLLDKQNENGSFSWFSGGGENVFITQHIVAGFGHFIQMFPEEKENIKEITAKAVDYLDKKINAKNIENKHYITNNLELHYWYARSFYLDYYPLNKKLTNIFNYQLEDFKKNWLTYSLYQKGIAAIILQRMGEKKWAKKIITHLKETAVKDKNKGMYWLENESGYYWYQSPIETQTILIEAFNEIETDKNYIEELKAWLLYKKQTNRWTTTKSTSDAVYALLLQGKDWTTTKENIKFTVGNDKISSKKMVESEKQAETGYIKINWNKEEITNEMGKISIDNKSKKPGFGGVYWQYFENLETVKRDSTSVLNIAKKLFKKVKTVNGNTLLEISENNIQVGDLITVQLIVKTKENLEFVHLKDSRASCFEPVDVLSEYKYKDGTSFYQSTKDVATHFFFDNLNKGTYILEYDVRINNSGKFSNGIATIQSMYAPEFSAHSNNQTIIIK
ncbi:MG2 domain-containing protein [Flavobacterium sp.]|uniref:alpha-2-macroglobulin family protein n=1 Tax=Flavobacterium sp. TaxID=239 RepID=UPI003528EA77